ncbi:glutathione synthase [Thiohalomonas denitrificans]|uniref:Glutathione synthetase n=1 Tax=Thiohalomonas denitrificans TaxID=415747 RepID=A0A1G5QJH9_9GAMM|nr:glutathione synthase [Thiohalomonas denitrificans]SCZ61862.1 glutathione synthase [Thiohalomonas denitrificans]
MTVTVGVVMDPIGAISYKKDSTLAMLLAAQRRGWELRYMEQRDLFLRDGMPSARMRPLRVHADPHHWYDLEEPAVHPLGSLDVILMRKDPPFDMEFIYTTYLLERAEEAGALVVNRAASLRDANEKLFTAWFPQCTPPTLVSRDADALRAFHAEQGATVFKPLGAMGGASIFKVEGADTNLNVIIETLTGNGTGFIMAQRFVPEIRAGDKRILLIDGEPAPYALARIPAQGDIRGNLAAGGRGETIPLSARDRWICKQVAPKLRKMGLIFVGLDVIGDFLTEINVTSPTCIRELDAACDLDIGGQLMDVIDRKLDRRATGKAHH